MTSSRASRSSWHRLRALGGLAILVAVVVDVGPDGALKAAGSAHAGSLAAGAALAAVTTTAAAWRWRLVSRRLGAELSLPWAVAECYRAQFLNAALPGGILGDVGRAMRHGRSVDDMGRGLRSVAWERSCGQVLLILCAAPALVAELHRMPWPGAPLGTLVAALTAGAAGAFVVWCSSQRMMAGIGRAVVEDARALLAPPASLPILVSSIVVLGGHVATFGLAARSVGLSLDHNQLIEVALFVLLIGGVPLNVAGWGPREGAAAWAFAGAGWGSSTGLAVAVAYGTIAFVATLPGAAAVLATRWASDHRRLRADD